MDEKLLDQAGDEAGTAAAEAIDGKGEAQAEPEGKDAPHSEPAEETFTQSRVNDIVTKRLERANRKTLERYGVESLEELDAIVGKAKEAEDLRKANGELSEKLAFITNRIAPEREEDVRVHFKGKGIEFTDENLKKELETHPEWIAASDKPLAPKATTIERLGAERSAKKGESDDERRKRVFGI